MSTNQGLNLYELLRRRRNEIAKEKDIKPFMVLHNKVLKEAAEVKPANLKELAEIKGLGEKKIAKYGELILKTIREFHDAPFPSIVVPPPTEKVFSVSEFIDSVNEVLIPRRAVIQGEVNQIKPMNGYAFFTLTDKTEDAILNCFVWQNRLDNFGVELKDGLELKVEGFPRVYKRRGSFSFEVERIGLVGEGELKRALLKLKKELARMGFFAPERKKPIPPYIRKIGLVTSTFGDAKNDFLTHLGKFGFQIYFYNARVEGIYAVDEITAAVRWFNENMLDIQVLVLTRGGGSLESLQPFNSKPVAKAIFGSKIPIITAIGHENNETFADLVADRYASTPTDAARIISDPWRNAEKILSHCQSNMISVLAGSYANMKYRLKEFENNFSLSIVKIINLCKKEIFNFQARLTLLFSRILDKIKAVENEFHSNREKLVNLIDALSQTVENQAKRLFPEPYRWLRSLEMRLSNIEQSLRLADPAGRLKQGYSIVFLDGKTVKSSRQIKVGQELGLKFYKGSADTRVERTHET